MGFGLAFLLSLVFVQVDEDESVGRRVDLECVLFYLLCKQIRMNWRPCESDGDGKKMRKKSLVLLCVGSR